MTKKILLSQGDKENAFQPVSPSCVFKVLLDDLDILTIALLLPVELRQVSVGQKALSARNRLFKKSFGSFGIAKLLEGFPFNKIIINSRGVAKVLKEDVGIETRFLIETDLKQEKSQLVKQRIIGSRFLRQRSV